MSELPRLSPEVVLPSSGATEPLVLSRGALFCVTNQAGDIAPAGARDLGFFCDDTRHLSYLELFIAGGPPLVLSADRAGATFAQIDLTLTDTQFGGFLSDPQNFLHLRRKHLLDGALVVQLVLTNHLRAPIDLWVELRLAADFADVFEVRGVKRARRGTLLPAQFAGDQLIFSYRGLDDVTYRTVVRMVPEPRRLGPTGPFYELRLLPGEATQLEIIVEAARGDHVVHSLRPFDERLSATRDEHARFVKNCARVTCSDGRFAAALASDLEDLDSLRLVASGQRIVGAGVPWFAAPFGRDAILTSFELLAIAPALAVESLRALAAWQGTRDDPWREEEPGKIMHELRRGELARTGEIPHSPYYGTVDATPLWLILLGATWDWLGDRALVEELLPAAERALAWVLRRLDEGGGFLRYRRAHEKSLENQGWKDSRDGVSFPDGAIARAPIALVEVQGYAVAALSAMARLYDDLGRPDAARPLRARADALRGALHAAFWVPRAAYYALALDGDERQVPTISSNPGHLLFCRAVDEQHAARVIEKLRDPGLDSGFGVRTVARGQSVFNPLSYHNGSVWPHDTALCALGASRYGDTATAAHFLDGLYAAAQHFRRYRLPELFCGLARAEGDFLVHYPVSCSPQAWASGALFLLLQACLGLQPDAPRGSLVIANPRLPDFLDELTLANLRVGGARLTLHFVRHGDRTQADVLALDGAPLRVQIEIS